MNQDYVNIQDILLTLKRLTKDEGLRLGTVVTHIVSFFWVLHQLSLPSNQHNQSVTVMTHIASLIKISL
jgi:hypothetical protein